MTSGDQDAASAIPDTAILVPDAGPLISLGRADLLSVLLAPGVPVWLVDQVVHEVTKDERFPDAVRCRELIRSHPDKVHVFETFVGKAAEAQRMAGFTGRQKGLGEAAVAEFLQRVDEATGDPLTRVIVVFEDSDVLGNRFTPGPNTHLVSTWSFLLGLEKMGRLASAETAWAAINAAGRHPSKADVDRPMPVRS